MMDPDIRKIETHEWHLWSLAFALILFLGSLTAATYVFLLSDPFQASGLLPSATNKAVGGLCVLILLFCAYVVQTRVTFGKMRGIIQRQSTYDDLTGLYNRRFFDQRIEEEIHRAEQDGHNVALLLCDLDHFKAINDSLGRQGGDNVLKAAARNIRDATRGTDLVFRWGGDEVAVILSDTGREGILVAAERIRQGIQKIAREWRLEMDISIGAGLYPEQAKNTDELIRQADRALYIAEKTGDKIHIGDQEYHLDEQAIKVVFQPIVDVWSDRILAYEGLCRDPEGKLSVPQLFKKYKAIGQLTELKHLCLRSQIKAAHKAGLQMAFINVDFRLLNRLEPAPRPGDMKVVLEISEAEVLHDVEDHLRVVHKWREEGYQFAIDDFGAGFISLPFIAQLLPDYIKIDRSTVLQAVTSTQFRGFLKKLVLAMRMYTSEGIIAEGIETEEELKVVKDLGIFLIQGYLLGRPQELN